MPFFGYYGLYSFLVYFGILSTWTVSHIYRKLKHGKAIANQLFSEVGCGFALLFCFRWQIKEYQDPHYFILAETVGHDIGISG